MDKDELKALINEHLEAVEPECRWCFAIDKQRVKGKIIAKYIFQDALLLHLSCPRCGGEFTIYAETWSKEYLNERIHKIHPEWKGEIGEEQFSEILDLVIPECSGIWKDC